MPLVKLTVDGLVRLTTNGLVKLTKTNFAGWQVGARNLSGRQRQTRQADRGGTIRLGQLARLTITD